MTEEQRIASACIESIDWDTVEFSQDNIGCSKEHIQTILRLIVDGEVTDSKAHRFIGWAQGVLCMEDIITLGGARNLNRSAIEEASD